MIGFEIDSWDYKVLLESLWIECDPEYIFVTPNAYRTTFIGNVIYRIKLPNKYVKV